MDLIWGYMYQGMATDICNVREVGSIPTTSTKQVKMVTDGWVKDKEFTNVYYKIKKFNTTFYKLDLTLDYNVKVLKIWACASSGKKRRDLEDAEPNDYKRDGGIKALLWMKNELLDILDYLDVQPHYKVYICISWADSKRRDVYGRLEREGFRFMVDEGSKILMKRIR